MHTHLRRTVRAGLFAVVGSVAIANSSLAGSISWSAPKILHERGGIYLEDAAFRGESVAVVWGRPYVDSPDVRIKSSDDGGATFSRMTVFHNATGAAVAICDDQVNLAFVSSTGRGRSAIDVAFGGIGHDGFVVKRVIGGRGDRFTPNIACAQGRVFVSWYEREGGPFRRRMAHALLSTHEFGEPLDLGLDRTNYDGYYSPRGFGIAAAADTAYAVFSGGDGKLRIKRWSIQATPDHAVAPHPVEVLANGTNNCPAAFPVIGVDDETVAVAWERNASIVVRVSTDQGASWKQVRDLFGIDCDAIVDGGGSPSSIEADGERMVVEVDSCGFGFCGSTLILTSDAFAHHTWEALWDGPERSQQNHLVGYVTVNGRTLLGDAYGNGQRVRYRHER